MPESRGRRPKKQRQVATQTGKPKSITAQATTVQLKRRWEKILRVFGVISGIVAGAVGLSAGAFGLLNEWPRPTIELTYAPEASNPFSGIFKVENTRFYPLDDVRIEAYLWCAKIGRGTDTTPPTMCKRGMASSKREWNKRGLAADDPYEIDVGDVLFATPSALLYGDISINVSYTPWVVPYHFNKEFRFYTRRKDDGGIEWLHKPLD
jgi:hypothetical protein